MKLKQIILISLLAFILIFSLSCKSKKNANEKSEATVTGIWRVEKAQEWGKNQPWLRGSNFNPSSAINQLETWQAESFDTATINRELGWAEGIGFNCMRVYMHHLAWEVDLIKSLTGVK